MTFEHFLSVNSMLSERNFRCIRLQLHSAIYRPDSFVLMLRYCANLKVIRYESTSLNRIVANKSHRVIVALGFSHSSRLLPAKEDHNIVSLDVFLLFESIIFLTRVLTHN